jgi:predicted pyridoxine 5'-phosphate oxidase superfamily flavin-nucleotide-binding protein
MDRRFAELAFTPLVKEEQTLHGSRHLYERAEHSPDLGDRLGPDEQAFIRERDGFYMASVTETGWPYIQFRGGHIGFLHVLDDHTIAFADLRGNRQYISTANLKHDDRVALFFMDYPTQSRLKVLGRAAIHEVDAEAEKLIASLRVPDEKTPPERAVVIHIEGFDWNCQQHITPRYSEAELAKILEPMRQRLEMLEAENRRLKAAS